MRDSASVLCDSFISTMLQDLAYRIMDDTGEYPDNIERENIDPEALQKISRDCQQFYVDNEHLIHAEGACERSIGQYSVVEHAGSDLYMTRVGHGVGFWDCSRWNKEQGEQLDSYVQGMGHFEGPYLGDDGKIYISFFPFLVADKQRLLHLREDSKMSKNKVQEITVKLRFDRPVTKTQAKRMFADTVHGEFYPCELDGAETMKIVSPKIRTSY